MFTIFLQIFGFSTSRQIGEKLKSVTILTNCIASESYEYRRIVSYRSAYCKLLLVLTLTDRARKPLFSDVLFYLHIK